MVENESLNIAKEYADKIRRNFYSSKVYLFGSFAKGTQHNESDIDIAVILDDYNDRLEIMMELMRLRRNIDSRIEPHPFRLKEFNTNNILASEILQHGVEI